MRLLLATLCAAAAACALTAAPAAPATSCGSGGYAYAGLMASTPARGVFGVLQATELPRVRGGHVAAWVGVGGEGYGPGGSTVWLQAGISGFPDGSSELYYEVALPGQKPRYVKIRAVQAGASIRVAVSSRPSLPGWWDVRVDGTSVSELIYLPGSEQGWEPIATAETWDGGTKLCNSFSFLFDSVRIASGSAWAPLKGSVLQDPGFRVKRSASGFLASSS